jgi:hypothetical protein
LLDRRAETLKIAGCVFSVSCSLPQNLKAQARNGKSAARHEVLQRSRAGKFSANILPHSRML